MPSQDLYKGLRNRILKVGLLPIILILILLGTFTLGLATHQNQKHFDEHIKATAQQLSLLASTALDMNDQETIQNLTRSALQQNGLHGLRISTGIGEALYQAGPPFKMNDWPRRPDQREQMLRMEQSTLITTPLETSTQDRKLWLEMEFNSEAIIVDQYQWLLLGLAVTILCMLVATVACIRLANSICSPLSSITHNLSRIHFSSADTRLPTEKRPDFDDLTQHINGLLGRMQLHYRTMKDELDNVTKSAQNNLESQQIDNAELILSRKLAMEANQAKSLFLANMSHEMRTPLNSIAGYTELLSRSNLDSIQREHIRTLSTASNSLLAIIDDILDFAKLEAGKLVLDAAPVDLRQVIDDVLAMNSPSAQNKNLELATIIHPGTPNLLTGDANRLKQIMSNLLSNAIKFTQEGSVIIQVHCENIENREATLRLSVDDTGIGISEKNAHKLFQAFSQVDTSRKRNTDGTGLGLVICKSLIEQMRGTIDFNSSVGEGSSFWFTIRLPIDTKARLQPPKQDRGTALLVESRPWSRQATSRLLEESGFRVQCIEQLNSYERVTEWLTKNDPPKLIVITCNPDEVSMHCLPHVMPFITEQSRTLLLATTAQLEDIAHLQDIHTAILPLPLSRQRLQEAVEQLFHELPAPTFNTPLKPSLPGGDKLHILAVDDNTPNLKLLSTMLTDIGVNVDTVESGSSALQALNHKRYDLIFMDIQMPDMDGMEATQQIRLRSGSDSGIPVIALTAHAMAEEKAELLEKGMDGYLTKPVTEQQLVHTLNEWLMPGRMPLKALPPASLDTGDAPSPATEKQPQKTRHTHNLKTISLPPVDWQEGIELAGDRKELAEELLDMLLASLDDTRAEIEYHLHKDDQKELLEAVHKLHGATRYCGVPPLREECNRLETALKTGDSAKSIEALVEELLEEISRLQVWQARFYRETETT